MIKCFRRFTLCTMIAGISVCARSQSDTTRKNIAIQGRPASLGIIGDTSDVTAKTKYGIVLMGGGKDVDAAFKWMIEKSGGGNVVIIRASGTNAYNPYVFNL